MTPNKISIHLVCLLSILLISACSASRPVLYPNSHLNSVGMEVAENDIAACINLAKSAGAANDKMSEVATDTAEGAVVGGVTGVAAGGVLGHAGRGAATGAAAGAAGGLTSSLFKSNKSNPVFQRIVDRCLSDKGYEPIGWK